jgi:ABC-type transport system involved in multi-copper enzyme maturation permease subunit
LAGKHNSVRSAAQVGQSFFYAIVGTQIALVLLAAPAATAGAICLDKARGTLAHLLVTDLADAEIVLGKLAARLTAAVGFVGCVLPVMALSTLLGGIDPVALIGALMITLALALFGCAVALALSVWASKPHEVLLGTYAVWAVWLLGVPMVDGVLGQLWGTSVPQELHYVDPFWLAFAPYVHPGASWLPPQATFAIVLMALSAGLTALTVVRVRSVAIRQMGQGVQRPPLSILWDSFGERLRRAGGRSRRLGFMGRFTPPGPSLDANPVLWREWHRKRPSRWLRAVWGLFVVLASAFSLLAVASALRGAKGEFAALVNAFQVSIGLLLLSVAAPMALAEERARGSLDVLLSTPLPTRSIVLGKWWGAYRGVVLLTFWPLVIAVCLLARRQPEDWPFPILLVALVLAQGAVLTSLGLALATWTRRTGRALAATVAVYVAVTVGWVMLFMPLQYQHSEGLSLLSPFWGAGVLTVLLEQSPVDRVGLLEVMQWAVVWIALCAATAVLLLWAILATFDRCLGRMPERPGRQVRSPVPGQRTRLSPRPSPICTP